MKSNILFFSSPISHSFGVRGLACRASAFSFVTLPCSMLPSRTRRVFFHSFKKICNFMTSSFSHMRKKHNAYFFNLFAFCNLPPCNRFSIRCFRRNGARHFPTKKPLKFFYDIIISHIATYSVFVINFTSSAFMRNQNKTPLSLKQSCYPPNLKFC